MCGDAPIVPVTVRELESGPDDSYWGWWEHAHERFDLVYPRRFLLEMCFAYGSRVEIEKGRGLMVPVEIIEGAGDGQGEDEGMAKGLPGGGFRAGQDHVPGL